jgi:HSP20 family molecular chaperone IbpA
MALPPRNISNHSSPFTPLFRLFDEFDQYSRQGGNPSHDRRGFPYWQPKFDICETANTFELHGELPGISKENIAIEFLEPQTMRIHGTVERTYTAGTPLESTFSGYAAAESVENTEISSKASEKNEKVSRCKSSYDVAKTSEQEKQTDSTKYWLAERSVGEFSRSFTFPSSVDQVGVIASLKEGILNVTVPKAKKQKPSYITVT